MRTKYIEKYVAGVHLRLSLEALWQHISWPPERGALTMTGWGPFYLTGTNAPFIPAFVRTVDRALYHAGNVWRQLSKNVSNSWALGHLEPGAIMQTQDRVSKYEIEAFIGAVVGVTEDNLIGVIRNNRLGKSFALGPVLMQEIRQASLDFKQLGTDKKWHTLRNSVYHLNPNLRD